MSKNYNLERTLPNLSAEDEQLVLELAFFKTRLIAGDVDEHLIEIFDELLGRVFPIIEEHSVSHTDITESISDLTRDEEGNAVLPVELEALFRESVKSAKAPEWSASPDDDDEYCDPWLDPYCVEALKAAREKEV